MRKKISILFLVFFLFSLFLFLWWQQAVKPINPTSTAPVIFVISRGESVRSIAERLEKEGLIRSSLAFFLLARIGPLGSRLQAGDFRLNPSLDLFSLGEALTHGTLDVWLTIPEGWRNEEIALKLAQELSLPESEFLKVAKEGYMFPDTYLIPKEATAGGVAAIFLNNFNKKVTSDKIDEARKKGLSLSKLIILASLVEREAKFAADRPLVASVLLNRLKIEMKLDVDATVQYALGYQAEEKTWWKKVLTKEDLEIDSPFNTYKNPGLPPTPIANPGLAAILAVLDAPQTDYFYYLSAKTGKLHFAKTLEEHQTNIAKYL